MSESVDEKARVSDQVDALLRYMQPDERVEFLASLGSDYCRHCGYAQPKVGSPCQCWNDE